MMDDITRQAIDNLISDSILAEMLEDIRYKSIVQAKLTTDISPMREKDIRLALDALELADRADDLMVKINCGNCRGVEEEDESH